MHLWSVCNTCHVIGSCFCSRDAGYHSYYRNICAFDVALRSICSANIQPFPWLSNALAPTELYMSLLGSQTHTQNLSQLLLSDQVDLQVRQLAAVLCRQYIDGHWSRLVCPHVRRSIASCSPRQTTLFSTSSPACLSWSHSRTCRK